jgi:colicin import membrane protein
VPFGLLVSFVCHAALIAWSVLSMRAVQQLPVEDTPAISAAIITPSEFLRLKQGNEDSKNLETKAKDKPAEDDSKNDTKKPDNAPPPPPPPPPQEVAKADPPPPPEPPKVAEPPPPPPEPPKPDPIAEKMKEPPPPEPAPGPTPEETQALEQKIEDQRKADEAKKKADEEARKKKLAEELKKKKLAEAAKKKAEEAKKFDANKLASLIDKAPDDAEKQKALLDKDPKKKGQQAAGTSQTATATGQEAGTATGKDTVLSAREQDLLKGLIQGQLHQCWRLPGAGGGGSEIPVVTLSWKLNQDGSLNGEPVVKSAPNDTLGSAASEAALRAVRGCQPFHLPPEHYQDWKEIEWDFDPRQML